MVNNFICRPTVFETNCDVDPNRIEELCRYSSPTEDVLLGRKQCVGQTIKLRRATIAALQSKIATITGTFIASCLLPHTTSANFGNPHEFKATVERANFDMPAAAPIEFLATSRELNAAVEQISFDMHSVASVAFISPPLEFKAVLQPASLQYPPRRP